MTFLIILCRWNVWPCVVWRETQELSMINDHKTTSEIWCLFFFAILSEQASDCFSCITSVSKYLFDFDLQQYELQILKKTWNMNILWTNWKMMKSRFLKKYQKTCDRGFHLIKADIFLQSDSELLPQYSLQVTVWLCAVWRETYHPSMINDHKTTSVMPLLLQSWLSWHQIASAVSAISNDLCDFDLPTYELQRLKKITKYECFVKKIQKLMKSSFPKKS